MLKSWGGGGNAQGYLRLDCGGLDQEPGLELPHAWGPCPTERGSRSPEALGTGDRQKQRQAGGGGEGHGQHVSAPWGGGGVGSRSSISKTLTTRGAQGWGQEQVPSSKGLGACTKHLV